MDFYFFGMANSELNVAVANNICIIIVLTRKTMDIKKQLTKCKFFAKELFWEFSRDCNKLFSRIGYEH